MSIVTPLVLVCLLVSAATAEAYIGPGAGISVIGTAVAFVGAVVFALIGFVWYPIKRLRASLRNSRSGGNQDPNTSWP